MNLKMRFSITINLMIVLIDSINTLPMITFSDFHATLTNASRPTLIPLNHTLLNNELTHIDLPKYITEPSSNIPLELSSTRESSTSYMNPPIDHQPRPLLHRYPVVDNNQMSHQSQRSPNRGNRNIRNNHMNSNRMYMSRSPERDNQPNDPNYTMSSSSNRINHNHPSASNSRARGINANRLRSPSPQPAPPLEKTGYDYDYDTNDYMPSDDRLSSGSSTQDINGRVLLSPKTSMYRKKSGEEKDDLRSSRSSHRSENWTPPNARNSKYPANNSHKRASESSRYDNYSRRGQNGDSRRPQSPPEYYYPEPSADEYNQQWNHHPHRPLPRTNAPRQGNRVNRAPVYPQVTPNNDDYPVDAYDSPPLSPSGKHDASYAEDHPSGDAFYDKESADDNDADPSDDGSLDADTDSGNHSDVSDIDPDSASVDDGNDNAHGEETLDDDDTQEVRSQTLYTSGSDEIPDDMRLPYHNAPVDHREIASDSFLTHREFAADALVDQAKRHHTTK